MGPSNILSFENQLVDWILYVTKKSFQWPRNNY